MEIKNIIKEKRLEKGLTMKQLAGMVGVSEATISRWESGDIANMKRDKIATLAKVLDIPPAVIMGWDEYEEVILTRKEKRFLEYFRLLNNAGQMSAMDSVEALTLLQKYQKGEER